MTFSLTLSGADLLLMLPEIILTLWLCGVFIVDFTFPKLPKEQLAYLSVCGLVIVLANLLWYDRTGVSGTLFHQHVCHGSDGASFSRCWSLAPQSW